MDLKIFWGGDLELLNENNVRIHLANWVAGEVLAFSDIPTTGSATYSGHAIGTVVNGGDVYQAVGNFELNFNFATADVGSSTGTITDFDSRDFDLGSVDFSAVPTGENVFTGNITGTSSNAIGIDGTFTGSFMKGGAPPPALPAEMGGQFSVKSTTGPSYGAAGIFAGKQP